MALLEVRAACSRFFSEIRATLGTMTDHGELNLSNAYADGTALSGAFVSF